MQIEYYIIGSGGFAKEVYFLAESCLDGSYHFKGFIDYKPTQSCLTIRERNEKVIDEDFFLKNIPPSDTICLFMGVGDPRLLDGLSKRFNQYKFPNLFHSSFVFDERSVFFGIGNIVTAGCIFTVDIQIGSFNVFNLHTTLGHDSNIGDCNVFNPGANISGGVVIGSRNLLGTNSTLLQLVKIMDNNIIGASSLLTKSIESNCTMVGVPAKKLEK